MESTNQVNHELNQPIALRKGKRSSRLRQKPPKYNVPTSDDDDDDDSDNEYVEQIQKSFKRNKQNINKKKRKKRKQKKKYKNGECICAKSKEFPWWPAKIISKTPNKPKYVVKFFFKDKAAQQNHQNDDSDDDKYVYIYIYIYL